MQVSTVYFPVSQADFNSLTVMDRIFVYGTSPRGFTCCLHCYGLWNTHGHGKTYKILISRGGLPRDGAW
jgi:hypothetical protein